MDSEGNFDDLMGVDPPFSLLIIIVIILSGVLVNWKFLRNMRDDDKNRGPNSNGILIRDVMETHAKIQMVILPTLMILIWMVNNGVEFPVWLHPSFCYINVAGRLFRIYVAFNSLVVAAMRYTFIVHQNCIYVFGIEKAKRLYYYASIIIPVMIGIMTECTIEQSSHEFRENSFALCIDSYQNRRNITDYKSNISQSLRSPIYFFVHQYVSTEITYYVGIFVKICIYIIFGNVVEGVLYWKTFSYIRR